MDAPIARDMQRNLELIQQQQAQLAAGARRSAALTELAARERRHRLRAMLWSITRWRARQRGAAAVGSRNWDR